MTKTSSPLVVAAHIHHPKTPQTARSGVVAGTLKKGRGRVGPKTEIQSGEFKAPNVGTGSKSQKSKARASVPISATSEGLSNDVTPSDNASTTSRSSSPELEGLPTVPKAPAVKLANDKVKELKDKGNVMEGMIEELESLAYEFKGRVQDASYQYKKLKTQVEHVALEFEALEDDHLAAIDVLDQERSTSFDYLQKLRLAEKEIFYLYKAINDDPTACGGFSQPKSTEAFYDRYR